MSEAVKAPSYSRSQSVRQALHLSIHPSPYDSRGLSSDADSDSPSSSTRIGRSSNDTTNTTPTSSLESPSQSVLCLYDFESRDPDHLAFKKNEILDVVKQESTGWWAAMRPGGQRVGWIPEAFVQPLSEEMNERLRNIQQELRVYEYEAEQLYNEAPIVNNRHIYDASSSSRAPEAAKHAGPSGRDNSKSSQLHAQYLSGGNAHIFALNKNSQPPPSPSTPVPYPPVKSAPAANARKSHSPPPMERSRSNSSPTGGCRNTRRRPVLVDDKASLNRLSVLIESTNPREVERLASPKASGSVLSKRQPHSPFTTSCDEAYLHHAVAQANLPYYLYPVYAHQLKFDNEGMIKAGTLPALVERLMCDPLTKDPHRIAQDTRFRNVFLVTFRTFTTPDHLFDMLVDQYRMNPPDDLSDAEFEIWKERKQAGTQRRVLTVFTSWLEDHHLLEEEPHIARRLTDFLNIIIAAPSPTGSNAAGLALTSRLILQSIERLTFASASSPVSPQKRRKSKTHKNDLLRLDPLDVAQQLALMEYQLYAKITVQECMHWSSMQTGPKVANILAFSGTHDKLASWVKVSILNNEGLGKRADTVDFWIKVAEKCRSLNNFSSMSAVINALSSTVIQRLHLTHAHVGRKSNLDAMVKFSGPTGGFAGYRGLLSTVEGPCVPFVAMFLTDLVRIKDQYTDTTIATATNQEEPLISYTQRQRWFDVISAMLRYQNKPYTFGERESTRNFLQGHLKLASLKEQNWFWTKSQQVQQTELAHADIRKGLEAAGF